MKLHRLDNDTTHITLPERFTFPHNYTPHPLSLLAAEQMQRYLTSLGEATEGKMYGLLVVQSADGSLGFLAAFSGLLEGRYEHDYFVPPIFDMLDERGYFKLEERAISAINIQVDQLTHSAEYQQLTSKLAQIKGEWQQKIEATKISYTESKSRRKAERTAGISAEQQARHIAESQFQKGEIKRMQHQAAVAMASLTEVLDAINERINTLNRERKARSAALQEWLFEQFVVLNALGESRSIGEIFRTTAHRTPPAGSGECAAPKLLQYAFANGLRPIAMAEFWWGPSPLSQQRTHGNFYGACKGKCEPILGFMLQGIAVDSDPLSGCGEQLHELDILFEDQHFIIINKPAGLLSADGKSSAVSALSLARERYGEVMGIHRLDMATSGLLIIALDPLVGRELQRSFASREVIKRYVALLDGELMEPSGTIDLPLSADPHDRPRQRVDRSKGRSAVTHYRLLEKVNDRSRVELYPLTGRTHQLRLHSAHAEGLNIPIVGDALYGTPSDRLYLHAEYLNFTHPISGEKIEITAPAPF